MGTNKDEGFLEKTKEFFWQSPDDRAYEEAGGDDRVPVEERTDDPVADAARYRKEHGEKPQASTTE